MPVLHDKFESFVTLDNEFTFIAIWGGFYVTLLRVFESGFGELFVQKFYLIFDNLWVVVAHSIDDMGSFFENHRVSRITELKELVLLFHKHAIVDKPPT